MARVLIVDDSPAWRAAARAAVAHAGHDVVAEAADGLEAIAACRTHHPDLVTLDIQMPGMTGLECLPHLRAVAPKLAVVMVSGASSSATQRRARELGAVGFVPKPYAAADLAQAISEALA